MHIVDVALALVAAVVIVLGIAVLARQRFMLRTIGAMPLAMQRGNRWLYGIGRYVADELRWYRAFGVGTRPSQVLHRGAVELLERRAPDSAERGALPPTAVVVVCRADGEICTLAFGDGAYPGFVSWLESSAPS